MTLQIIRDPQTGKLTANLDLSEVLKPIFERIKELESKVNEIKLSEIESVLNELKNGIEISLQYSKL